MNSKYIYGLFIRKICDGRGVLLNIVNYIVNMPSENRKNPPLDRSAIESSLSHLC